MKESKPSIFLLLFSGFVLFTILIMQGVEIWYGGDIAMLFPAGKIATEERNLLFIIQALMLLVVIPVYILTFVFSWKYEVHKKKAKYTPHWDDHRVAEYIWWGLPLVLVGAISVLTWYQTHKLDPYKPIASTQKPLTIQVVALQWKWLFLYPQEEIACINFCQIPEHTPIHFEITADAPMNSFWVPHLGGQIYAMPAMKTELHLIADKKGEFRGSSANLSGEGFASMTFTVKSSDEEEFQSWVQKAKQAKEALGWKEYQLLARPSASHPVEIYQLQDKDLFHQVLMKYMKE